MSTITGFTSPQTSDERETVSMDAEVVELALLLPRWQAHALENAANKRGMTAGQMLRSLIGATLARPAVLPS